MTKLQEREAALAEPAWEFARLFPAQGQWDEEDYFAIGMLNKRIQWPPSISIAKPLPCGKPSACLTWPRKSLRRD